MAAKKRPLKPEPLLITVARKLGLAAGALTNVTQELKENLSTLPESVARKVRNTANTGTPAKRPRIRTRRRARHAAAAPKTGMRGKRRSLSNESSRSKRKPVNRRARPQ
jgi:hypothetical protein